MENNEHRRTSKKDFQTGKVAGSGPFVQVPETVKFIAEQDILSFQVVTSDGQRADSTHLSHRNKVIGINIANVLNGFAGEAKGFGEITNPAWSWNIGDLIFLNGTSLSTIVPSSGFSQVIGTATAADTIDVKLMHAFLL